MSFVKERKQFGRPIAEFQGLQWMLADMAVALNAARLSLHQAALSADPFPDPLLAAQAKIIASETANMVTNQALQLFGARGYSRDYPLERMVRDARMFTIAGGTAQVLRTLVASRILGTKIPQTRNGYMEAVQAPSLAAK
jgi:alkylation response protein AidB-like acyl-CoA dehydrogenase